MRVRYIFRACYSSGREETIIISFTADEESTAAEWSDDAYDQAWNKAKDLARDGESVTDVINET